MNKLYPFYISIFIPYLHSIMYRKIDTKRLNNKHIDNRAIAEIAIVLLLFCIGMLRSETKSLSLMITIQKSNGT